MMRANRGESQSLPRWRFGLMGGVPPGPSPKLGFRGGVQWLGGVRARCAADERASGQGGQVVLPMDSVSPIFRVTTLSKNG